MNLKQILKESIKSYLIENPQNEVSKKYSKHKTAQMNDVSAKYAKKHYGDDFGKRNDLSSERFGVEITNDAYAATGIIGVGNSKLSDDTLIINFTTALDCPAAGFCPISQMACYATKDEIQYKDVLRKNAKIHNLLKRMQRNLGKEGAAKEYFSMIKELMEIMQYTPMKKNGAPAKNARPCDLKYIRFNEAGDFPNQETVNAAVDFCKWANEKYGIKAMAYTAMNNLDYRELSKVCAINASTQPVLDHMDDDAVKRNFFGRPSDEFEYEYAKPIENLDKSQEIKDNVATVDVTKYKPTSVKSDDISTPILNKGEVEGQEVYYYICPCSFWKDEKNKIEYPMVHKHGFKTLKQMVANLGKDDPRVKEVKRALNKVLSPCGKDCAVCHNMSGGIAKDTGEVIKNYAVLTALHGATKGYYSPTYATLKRMGLDAVYNKNNKNGKRTKDMDFKSDNPNKNLEKYGPDGSSDEMLQQLTGVKESFIRVFDLL